MEESGALSIGEGMGSIRQNTDFPTLKKGVGEVTSSKLGFTEEFQIRKEWGLGFFSLTYL